MPVAADSSMSESLEAQRANVFVDALALLLVRFDLPIQQSILDRELYSCSNHASYVPPQ